MANGSQAVYTFAEGEASKPCYAYYVIKLYIGISSDDVSEGTHVFLNILVRINLMIQLLAHLKLH